MGFAAIFEEGDLGKHAILTHKDWIFSSIDRSKLDFE
jgi:hypothetical protein